MKKTTPGIKKKAPIKPSKVATKTKTIALIPADYPLWLSSLKGRIAESRHRAALAVNAELIHLYWQIGREILERQTQQGWGAKVIDLLARDLREAFPDIKGLSSRNLHYMRLFAESCPNGAIVQQPAAQLPWFHIVLILTKLKTNTDREWYAKQIIEHGWTRSTLEVHLKNKLHARQAKAVTNFTARLPSPHSQLAHETLKDPYLFDFLGLGEDALERDIEDALTRHITHFLLEMGQGFAFVGRQVRIEVNGDEFFPDLLFYHMHLKCYVVVELKATAFKPGHTGQLNFYLAAVDAQLKAADDNPTIGLLLCKTQNRMVAQYALSGIDKPMGVAEYQLMRDLPNPLNSKLPSIEQLEAELRPNDTPTR